MTLRVVGAGVGRTGTASLKLALERLLQGRCYHMLEVLANPDDDQRARADQVAEHADHEPEGHHSRQDGEP